MVLARHVHGARLALPFALLALVAGSAARAQAPSEGKPRAGARPGAPTGPVTTRPSEVTPSLDDTAALGDFLDGVMRGHIETFRIPAAVVAVVKDDRVLYARGYGHADIAHGRAVDPATSLFRIGSTSKLFTWTAVMQLVEQGKLNLDADINTYLKQFRIPRTYPEPITLRSLMTHSPGFEDGALGYLITADSAAVQPIAVTLEEHMPARVRPPLELSSYSNYGAALAGLIVQDVSGVPFNDYIERNILEPLDMHHATFQEPLPSALQDDVVTAYVDEGGVYVAKPFEFIGGFRPAGSVSAAALDMTHFMIAHLQGGRYGTARILQPATAALMHHAAFTNDPRLPPMDLGFYEQHMNAQRVIGHEGDTQYFHTATFLIPDKQVGIFLSYDGSGGVPAREAMLQAFFDRYFPAASSPVLDPPADFARMVAGYLGDYRFARHSSTKIDKVTVLLEPPIRVSLLPAKDRLLVTGLGEVSQIQQYAPVAPGLFHEVEGHREIAFREDTLAHVMRLSASDFPFMGTEPMPWNEVPSLWYTLVGLSALVFLTVFTTLFYRRGEIRHMPPHEKRTVWLEVATAGWFFLTLIVIALVVAANADTIFQHIPTSLRVSLAMPVIFVLLTLALIVAAIRVWVRRYWGAGRRIHFTLVTLAAIAMCLFFNTWNVLGWRFG